MSTPVQPDDHRHLLRRALTITGALAAAGIAVPVMDAVLGRPAEAERPVAAARPPVAPRAAASVRTVLEQALRTGDLPAAISAHQGALNAQTLTALRSITPADFQVLRQLYDRYSSLRIDPDAVADNGGFFW